MHSGRGSLLLLLFFLSHYTFAQVVTPCEPAFKSSWLSSNTSDIIISGDCTFQPPSPGDQQVSQAVSRNIIGEQGNGSQLGSSIGASMDLAFSQQRYAADGKQSVVC